ncbi:ATP-binding protein [Propionivibrio sp.]|uniref:ATP-binding protein n=1 Tax=Propionivibrio sp. TaxID=2212460 RepID=UPI003BF19228
MALMAWSKIFVTGIDVVDNQHKGLVDLINAVAPQLAVIGEAPARSALPLLQQLAEYALSHFQYEEALMLAAGIDPWHLAHHQRSHTTFALEVTQMIQDSSLDNNVSGANLLRFLTSWLTFHILSEDQSMARQLRAIQAGTSPEAALASETTEDTSANAALVGALIDLFSLVTQRNKGLKKLNEELRLAKAELALSNEQLEARVADRTEKLKLANDELGRERQALLESLAQVQHAQAQLLQAEKMAAVGQLAAGVAHEINNPIGFLISNFGSLITYTERLFSLIDAYQKLEGELPAEHPSRLAVAQAREIAELDYLRQVIPDLLNESREGMARVKRIVNDLREFSHLDEGEWQDIDINHALESTLNVVSSELKDKLEVRKEFGEVSPVRCIPAQINQVFMNLLVNAAQAIPEQGKITLRTRHEGENVCVEITDTGTGIPQDIINRIFDPFFTTKPAGTGTGLGLSITHGIIRKHNGRIEVASEPGKGTTFRIVMPVQQKKT